MKKIDKHPARWGKVEIQEICDLKAGKFIDAMDILSKNDGSLFPCYGGNGQRGFVKRYSHDGVFPLIGRQGALCGNVRKGAGKFYATEHAIVVTPIEEADEVWLYYQLIYANLNKYATGVAQPGLSVRNIKEVCVPLPPLPEQKKIAEILSTWDQAIEKLEQLIELKEQRKKGLMQQLLTGKTRLPGFGKPVEKDGEIPDAWAKRKISDLGDIVTGSTPSKTKAENYGSNFCWATAKDFTSKYIFETKIKLSKIGIQKARLVPEGSVLITCIASIGKNAIAKTSLATNQQINSIIVCAQYSNEYIYYTLSYIKPLLIVLSGKTAVPILNKTSFGRINILTPSLKEQTKIANMLALCDEEIHKITKLKIKIESQKKGLMQKLLTGEVRVKVDEAVD